MVMVSGLSLPKTPSAVGGSLKGKHLAKAAADRQLLTRPKRRIRQAWLVSLVKKLPSQHHTTWKLEDCNPTVSTALFQYG